ncbi:MAG: inositol monophosphatase [Polyangiaceae bacterium]|nr:inositol monophosphatase [Polyangiaceae bacterium]
MKHMAILARDIGRAAGQLALGGFRTRTRIDRKQGTELVTKYDVDCEELIRKKLGAAEPGIQILGEEGGGSRDLECYFCVDPIDGTTNFAHGHPFWAVSIALVVESVPVAGAVVAPALGIEWMGWKGGSAYRNDVLCNVSETDSMADALLATGFPYDRQTNPDNNFAEFAHLQKRVVGIRRCGSAAIDLCLVSDGTYDGYWEKRLRPWDISAGMVMVWAAGGVVTGMEGREVDLNKCSVVASNGRIHGDLVMALREAVV